MAQQGSDGRSSYFINDDLMVYHDLYPRSFAGQGHNEAHFEFLVLTVFCNKEMIEALTSHNYS